MTTSDAGPSAPRWALLLLGPGLGTAAVLLVTRLGFAAGLPWSALALLLAGGGWAWSVHALRAAGDRSTLLLLLAGALVLRLAVLAAGDPGLSDDRHRYVWEGGLVVAGESPYAHAPSAEARAGERARWPGVYRRMNNTDVSAAYPPVTQAAAALVTLAAGGPAADDGRRAAHAMRLFFALCDLLVLVPLAVLLRLRGRPLGGLAVWAWSPLITLEFAGSGHFDSLGVLLLVGATAWLVSAQGAVPSGTDAGQGRRAARELLGLAALAGAVLVKLLAAPLLLLAWRASDRPLRAAGWTLGLIVLAFVPLAFLAGGFHGLTAGLGEYATRWESASLAFRHVEPLFDGLGPRDGTWGDPRRLARLAVGAVFLLIVVRLLVRRAPLDRAAFVTMGAFLVLSPTLHPWYLAWLAPWLALYPSRAWTWLMVAAPLLYWPLRGWQANGSWVEPAWLWPLVALPFLALLAIELVRGPGRALPGRRT